MKNKILSAKANAKVNFFIFYVKKGQKKVIGFRLRQKMRVRTLILKNTIL